MKTLANCSPREFLVQTNKIRKAVDGWLKLTKIMDIRKNVPKIPEIPEDATDEEKRKIGEEKRKILEDQMRVNTKLILDAILEEHPSKTAELLGLMCFVEPEDLDNHKMTEFFGAFAEMLNSQEIMDFFISLMQLGSGNIFGFAKE